MPTNANASTVVPADDVDTCPPILPPQSQFGCATVTPFCICSYDIAITGGVFLTQDCDGCWMKVIGDRVCTPTNNKTFNEFSWAHCVDLDGFVDVCPCDSSLQRFIVTCPECDE